MLRHLDLFSGVGGFSLAARWCGGFETTQFIEIEPFCQQILKKHWPGVSIHDDIKSFTAQPNSWDVATVSFPCQDLSEANVQGKGLDGEKSGLWFEALRVIKESQPQYIVIENVPSTPRRNWLRTILEGLASFGYDAEWNIVSAADVGAAHLRRRHWVVAYSASFRFQEAELETRKFSQSALEQTQTRWQKIGEHPFVVGGRTKRVPIARTLRSIDGFPVEMDRFRVKAMGNAVVPQAAMIPLLRVLHIDRWVKGAAA